MNDLQIIILFLLSINITLLIVNYKETKNVSNFKDLYNKKKCNNCIVQQKKLQQKENCPHCGSENYDTGCIPLIVQPNGKKPNNCIPKSTSKKDAYWQCKAASDNNTSCTVLNPNSKNKLPYMYDECGEDYYCGYDQTDSCTHNICNKNDYYEPNSVCVCGTPPGENLGENLGRECKNEDCTDYLSLNRKPHELLNDPRLKLFYCGYGSYMDISDYSGTSQALLINNQVI